MDRTIRRGGRDYKSGKPNDNSDQYCRHMIGKGMVACLLDVHSSIRIFPRIRASNQVGRKAQALPAWKRAITLKYWNIIESVVKQPEPASVVARMLVTPPVGMIFLKP